MGLMPFRHDPPNAINWTGCSALSLSSMSPQIRMPQHVMDAAPGGAGPTILLLTGYTDPCALSAIQCPQGHCLDRNQALLSWLSYSLEWFAGVTRGVIHSSPISVQPLIFGSITAIPPAVRQGHAVGVCVGAFATYRSTREAAFDSHKNPHCKPL